MASGSILLHEVDCLLAEPTTSGLLASSNSRRELSFVSDRGAHPAPSFHNRLEDRPGHLFSPSFNKTVDLSTVALDQYQRSGLSSRHGAAILGPSPCAVARPSEVVGAPSIVFPHGTTSAPFLSASVSTHPPTAAAAAQALSAAQTATPAATTSSSPGVITEHQLRTAATQRGSVETAAAVHALISLAASNNDVTELDILCRRLRVLEIQDVEAAIELVEAHNQLLKKRCNKLYEEINRINDQQVALLSAIVESHEPQRYARQHSGGTSFGDGSSEERTADDIAENQLKSAPTNFVDKAAASPPRSGPLTARRL
jgi:hypothetical protein